MKCKRCGSMIPNGTNACPNCGTPVPRKNTAAVIGFIFGIVGLLFCWIPLLGLLGVITGLVFSIIGVTKKNGSGKGMAITGIILSSLGIIIGCGITGSSFGSSNKTKATQVTTSNAIVSTTEEGSQSSDLSIETTGESTKEESTTEEATTEEITDESKTGENGMRYDPETGKWSKVTIETTTEKVTEETTTTDFTTVQTEGVSKKEFMKSCSAINYKKVARNPENYIGQNFYAYVYVSSARQGGLFTGYQKYFISYVFDKKEADKYIKKGWYDNYSEAAAIASDLKKSIWLLDNRKESDLEYIKILESDVVKVYGTFTGMQKTTNSLNGESGEEVALDIKYVEILE